MPSATSPAPAWRWFLLLSLPLYLLDQGTKALITATIPANSGFPVIPGFFDLVHWHNTGAAFGLGRGNNMLFIAFSTIAILGILVAVGRRFVTDPWSVIGVAFLLAGVLGNLTDRLRFGWVTDFLYFYVGSWGWPAFNVADICICTAAGCFLLGGFRKETPTQPPTHVPSPGTNNTSHDPNIDP